MSRNKDTNIEMRAQSQTALLAAARRLFAERGYDGCTISEIAKAAKMSPGNVYWYYTSKEELLKSVLADGFESMEISMAKAAILPGTARQKLDALVDEYINFARQRSDFTTIFLSLLAQGGIERLRALGFDTMQIGTRYHQHAASILAQGQQEGTWADIPVEALTMFFFAFFNGLMLTYRNDWDSVPPELIHQAVYRLVGHDASQ